MLPGARDTRVMQNKADKAALMEIMFTKWEHQITVQVNW